MSPILLSNDMHATRFYWWLPSALRLCSTEPVQPRRRAMRC